jgi:outer membrane protein OmpA-like peptidoglycan-associated protein
MPFLSARATALVVGVILLVGAGIVAQSPGPVKRKLGPEINGPRREIVPIVSPDGTTLFFSREGYEVDQTLVDQEIGPPPKPAAAQPPKPADPAVLEMLKKGGLSEAEIQKFKAMLEQGQKESAEAARNQPPPTGGVMGTMGQHAWMSKRRPDGSWGKAEYVPPPINKAFGASAVYAALPDNNTLLVGGRFDPSSEEIQNLFNPEAKKPAAKNTIAALTTRTATGWSTPVYLDIEGFDTTAPRNDFFLAPDGKVLLLSIENAQSLGKRDLYVSFAKAGKGWTRPKNLGAPINSPAHEGGPFIAPDGVTLYFTSNREGGLGEYDIYVTRRLDDTWLRWSAPENAGPGINTPQADTFLSVDASGSYAFMASGKLMEEDIYEFTLPAALTPKPVAFVRGRVKSPAGTAVAAGIAYERLRDGTGAGAASAEPRDGRYQIALPLGEDYGFLAQASGYISVSERVDLRAAKTNDVIERDLTLVPLKTREPIRLNNVFFRTNEAVLLPESARELNRLVQLLKDNPAMRIEVAGHTDALSDDIFNQKLSEARAAAVVAYLMNGGIAAARLQSRGFGESRPVADNTTEQGRALNRRVEFTIVQ